MFLPTTENEMKQLGWECCDIIIVTGDSYIDSPYIGAALIGRVLSEAGFKVGIIAQPDVTSPSDIIRLGEPALFWGVTGGSVDSLVANRTASGKKRKKDDYTPGGVNDRRPDRALIIYSNLIKQNFKNSVPLVLGGIEASLRRVAHYDAWTDKVRRSVLFDAKADYLLYGMAERSVLELAAALRDGTDPKAVRGLCYISSELPADTVEIPSYDDSASDKDCFTEMFRTFYRNNDPVTASALAQKQDSRYLVQNPPSVYLEQKDLDALYDLPFELDVHPFYKEQGDVRALDTIRFSITTHRGCYGECSFCAIAVHQGRTVRWRSEESILREARRMAAHPEFKGSILDVGGPTANMYGFECSRKSGKGCCQDRRCLWPEVCPALKPDHSAQIALLSKLRNIKGIKRVTVASGIRYDLILDDKKKGREYLAAIVEHHVSGQMKVAPEHTDKDVLDLMGKPGPDSLLKFKRMFDQLTLESDRKQFLTYYLIAAHPGSSCEDMRRLKKFCSEKLKTNPEQVQIFTPTPSTYSTLMYWTEKDPFTGKECFVEKGLKGKEQQKSIVVPQVKRSDIHSGPRRGTQRGRRR